MKTRASVDSGKRRGLPEWARMMRNNDEGQYNRQQEQARKGVIMRKGILVIEKSEQQPHTHTEAHTFQSPTGISWSQLSCRERTRGEKKKGINIDRDKCCQTLISGCIHWWQAECFSEEHVKICTFSRSLPPGASLQCSLWCYIVLKHEQIPGQILGTH